MNPNNQIGSGTQPASAELVADRAGALAPKSNSHSSSVSLSLEEAKKAEALARLFHEAYERLAPSFGYTTREESAKEWESIPAPNKSLMVAVATEVLARGVVSASLVEAAQGLIGELESRHYGRMPDEVQRALDRVKEALRAADVQQVSQLQEENQRLHRELERAECQHLPIPMTVQAIQHEITEFFRGWPTRGRFVAWVDRLIHELQRCNADKESAEALAAERQQEIEKLIETWTDPGWWSVHGAAMDSRDCAVYLKNALQAQRAPSTEER